MPAAAHLITRMLALAFFAFSAIVAMPGEADARSDHNRMNDYRSEVGDRDPGARGTGEHDNSGVCAQLGDVDGTQALAVPECPAGSTPRNPSSGGGTPGGPPTPPPPTPYCDPGGAEDDESPVGDSHPTVQRLNVDASAPETGHVRGSIHPAEISFSHDGTSSLDCSPHCSSSTLRVTSMNVSANMAVDAPGGYDHGRSDGDWALVGASSVSGDRASKSLTGLSGTSTRSTEEEVLHFLASPDHGAEFEVSANGTATVQTQIDTLVTPRCRWSDSGNVANGPEDPYPSTDSRSHWGVPVNFNWDGGRQWPAIGSRS